MDRKLEKAKAALKARNSSFPVLVLDGDASKDKASFRATIYGADFKPVSPATTDMTQEQVSKGQHFMLRMRDRAEWDAEVARAYRDSGAA